MPLIVADAFFVIGLPLIVKVAVFAPAFTLIEAGRETNCWFDDRFTTKPLAGATAVSVTVPVAVLGTVIAAGVTTNLIKRTTGGFTTRIAFAVFLEGSVPVMVVRATPATV